MSDQREQYLEALGIPVWKLRAAPATTVQPAAAVPLEVVATQLVAGEVAAPATMAWDDLAAAVRVCTSAAAMPTCS
jgi:hypothetical protein